MGKRINARELARGHFGEAKRRAHNKGEHTPVHIAGMRNAWAAHHAGAFWQNTDWTPRHPDGNGGPWSSDYHRGSASGRMSGMVALDEARVREDRLRAEQACLLARHEGACADNDRLRAEVERLEGEAEGWARVAGSAALRAYTTGAEVERLRSNAKRLAGDWAGGMDILELDGRINALTREGGEGP